MTTSPEAEEGIFELICFLSFVRHLNVCEDYPTSASVRDWGE